jgi:uroporphyrinogen-III synthase
MIPVPSLPFGTLAHNPEVCMLPERPVLLMTRPAFSSEGFLDRMPADLRAQFDPVIAPLLDICPVADRIDAGAARGIILTSANAVRVARDLGFATDLPCFCVGARTTQAARASGWHADTTAETAQQLIARLQHKRPETPLLHLCGRHRRGQIAEHLTQAGLPTTEQPIYDQRLLPIAPDILVRLSGRRVVAPLFSPRTARQFVEQVPDRRHIHAIALSDAVAEPLLSSDFASVSIAGTPDGSAMMDALRRCLAANARLEAK